LPFEGIHRDDPAIGSIIALDDDLDEQMREVGQGMLGVETFPIFVVYRD